MAVLVNFSVWYCVIFWRTGFEIWQRLRNRHTTTALTLKASLLEFEDRWYALDVKDWDGRGSLKVILAHLTFAVRAEWRLIV